MQRVIERGCGLDVHKKSIAACVLIPDADGDCRQEVRTFGTTAAELLALRDWLDAHGVTHVAMESTGVYWKPVFYVLEEAMTCVLVNPVHMRQVPGRKTDVQDCVWIAQLLEHGLLRGSFVPPVPIRELRDLTRYRKTIVQERTRAINWLHKVLEDADIKLASVATDVLRALGRAMLAALVAGTTDPTRSRTWRGGRSARSCPRCGRRSADDSAPITPSCSARSWRMWTTWRRPSRRWGSRSAYSSRPSATTWSASAPSRA
jgi:transposase